MRLAALYRRRVPPKGGFSRQVTLQHRRHHICISLECRLGRLRQSVVPHEIHRGIVCIYQVGVRVKYSHCASLLWKHIRLTLLNPAGAMIHGWALELERQRKEHRDIESKL